MFYITDVSFVRKYQLVFRHLLYLKYVERKLCDVFLFHQDMRKLMIVWLSFSLLRHRMLTFLRTYLFYLTNDVIEVESFEFTEFLQKVQITNRIYRTNSRRMTDNVFISSSFTFNLSFFFIDLSCVVYF